MKRFFKWLLIFTTSLIFIYAFSASYSSQNIDNLDYVIAISVDSIPDSDSLEVSFEFANVSSFSDNSSSDSKEPIIDTVSAPSISSAVNIMNAYAGKQINLSHCKVVVFSEEIAKKGLLPEITFLMNDTQIRPTTNVIISTDKAKNYIENSVSSLEQVLTKYYDIFPTSSEYTGYTSDILLGDFYANLLEKNSGAVTILGVESEKSNQAKKGSDSQDSSQSQENSESQQSNGNPTSSKQQSNESAQENQNDYIEDNSGDSIDTIKAGESIIKGDRGTENIGLAVFKNDIFIGRLSAIETLFYSLLKNEVYNFLISIDNPFNENEKIDLSVSRLSSSSFSVDTSKDYPIINIKLNLTAKSLTLPETLDYSDTDTLNKLNDSLKDYISSQMKNYLLKTSTEYKCDINGFFKKAKKQFKTIPDFNNYNWEQKYPNAEFNIDINSDVTSSFLLQNS